MATVTFSAADDVLYAYLAGEIDHDAAQGLRIQLDDALLTRSPRILVMDLGGVGFMDSSGIYWGGSAAPGRWAAVCASSTRRNSSGGSYSLQASPAPSRAGKYQEGYK